MAWVRIDDQAPRHRKMLKAGPEACWLWVCGIAHCQSQLTDGFISLDVLPMIGVANGARCRKLAETLVEAGLFDRADGGYMVHGYLDLNPSRDAVLKKRAEDAERKRKSENKPVDDQRIPAGGGAESRAPRAGVPSHPIRSEPRTLDLARTPTDDRIEAFVHRYPVLYAKCRSGAQYRVNEARDFPAFVDIIDREPDDHRLDALLELFLTVKSKDWLNTPGTPRQFLHMLPECDRLLRENGR